MRQSSVVSPFSTALGQRQLHAAPRRLFGRKLTLLLVLVAAAWSLPAVANVCRVTTSGSASDNGSDWAPPTMSLLAALGDTRCTEIWVKAGVYTPGTSRSDSFDIPPRVAVYGGFAGTESRRDQRDPAANQTILSGDLAGDDGSDVHGIDQTSTAIVGSNAYHVVTISATALVSIQSSTLLDGFVVTGGSATGSEFNSFGGGLLCDASYDDCSPTINNVSFVGNRASFGGGMYLFAQVTTSGVVAATLTQVGFRGNTASNGGALMIDATDSGEAVLTLAGVSFSGNSATGNGGAIHVDASGDGYFDMSIINATFANNFAGAYGGAIYAASHTQGRSAGLGNLFIYNTTFHGNYAAKYGGAIMDAEVDLPGGAYIFNSILWGDSAGIDYSEVALSLGTSNTTLFSSVVQGSRGSGDYWNNLLGLDGGGNLDADPLLGPLANHGGSTLTLVPGAASPAIDAGLASVCPLEDQRGIARPLGNHCDIGAVEVRPVRVSVVSNDGGSVSAQTSPPALSGGITTCTVDGGSCTAWYSGEGGTVVSLDLVPDPSQTILSVSGCGGTLTDNVFTTAVLSADCTVDVRFAGTSHSVSASADTHGSITPALQFVDLHQSATFTVTYDAGYTPSIFGDTCTPIQTSANQWTASDIIADCTVEAGFFPAHYFVKAWRDPQGPYGNLDVTTTGLIGPGDTVNLTVEPMSGYHLVSVIGDTCTPVHGIGTAWSVINIHADCTVLGKFAAGSQYYVGGTLSGLLAGSTLVLSINGGDNLTLTADGAFQFLTTLAPGTSYAVTVASQPSAPPQVCTLSNSTGGVTQADIASVAVSCLPNLALSVTDHSDFARYGQARHYTVALVNHSDHSVASLAVSGVASAAFDASGVSWRCIGTTGGATCNAASGALGDSVTVPAGASVTWMVAAPIRPNSNESSATFSVSASGAGSVSDSNTLVLFRAGFDVANGGGTQATIAAVGTNSIHSK